ncbi:MAG: hypothetical protein HY650_03265 [Acidobacteria bacterium]|nr:hypothetical protein [Acidobacteriota bacterium]
MALIGSSGCRTVGLVLLFCPILFSAGCGREGARGRWVQQPTMRQDAFFGLRFIDERNGFLVGWDGLSEGKTGGWTVIVSDDSGLTWKPMTGQAEAKIRKVFFLTPQTGWAITLENHILHTQDAGALWTVQRSAGVIQARNESMPEGKKLVEMPEPVDHLFFVDAKTGWAWGGGRQQPGFSMPGVLLRTVDGGATWQTLGYPFGNEIVALDFVDADHGWTCEMKGSSYKTTDGGRSWSMMTTREGFTGNALSFSDTEHGWIVGNGGYALRTSNGGRSWEYRRAGHGKDLRDVWFLNPREGWIVGNGGTMLYTSNGGNDWRVVESTVTTDLTHIQFLTSNHGWAAGNGGVLLRYEELK